VVIEVKLRTVKEDVRIGAVPTYQQSYYEQNVPLCHPGDLLWAVASVKL
jgi:hypothetical protein